MQGVNNETAWLNSTYILTIHHSNTILIHFQAQIMQQQRLEDKECMCSYSFYESESASKLDIA